MRVARLLELLAVPLMQVGSAFRDQFLAGLSLDSRAAKANFAFFALQGTSAHGLQFAARAAANGASLVLSDAAPNPGFEADVPVLVVTDLREKLGSIAAEFYARSAPMRCIGVTGTNGKTSSVHLIAQSLALLGEACASIGTLGIGFPGALHAGERTTPDIFSVHEALQSMSSQGAKALAMEVSSHALDQRRVDSVPYQIAMFTNLSRDHLDYHPDMQAYFSAKAKLFEVQGLKTVVINCDDPFGERLLQQSRARGLSCIAYQIRTAGPAAPQTANSAECLVASAVELSTSGLRFTVGYQGKTAKIESALIGSFNVENLLGVIGVLLASGYALHDISAVVPKLTPVVGRMSKLGGVAQPLVVVDYAHTPDALVQALGSLRGHTKGKLICAFGCGGDRDPGKRPLMAAAVDGFADVVILTSDNPRSEDPSKIAQDVLPGFRKILPLVELDRSRAIQRAVALAELGDTVLIAGKGHERFQEVAGKLLPFDDQQEAEYALQQWSRAA